MMTHAKYSPSKLSRIMACPGSVGLSEAVPPASSNSYAEEGTLLHAITAECLEQYPNYDLDSIVWESFEHRLLVSQCLERIEGLLATFETFQLFNDTRVYMKDIDCNGTMDVGIYGVTKEEQHQIHVIDFKFGGGIEVSPTNNPQGLAYLDGFRNQLKYKSNAAHMFFWIYQPRLDNFECDRIFEEDLQYFRNRLEKAIRLAEGRNPPFYPGIEQCRWCPAGGVCKTRMADVRRNIVSVFEAHTDQQSWDASIETTEALSKLLQTKSAVNTAFSAIEQHLFVQLSRGHAVPGYKLVPGRASRAWAVGVDAFMLNELFPQLDTTDLVEAKLRSPAQVEKMVKAKERGTLAELIIRTEGAPTMAPESSAKEAINPNPFADMVG